MAWTTPTLKEIRELVRDAVTARLGSGPMIANSVLRVLSDANAGLAHLTLRYVDWLSRQFLPDTAEGEWLRERHARIWLGGWKEATFASGTISATGVEGAIVPEGTRLSAGSGASVIEYATTEQKTIGATATTIPVKALTAGAVGNLDAGAAISFSTAISEVDGGATVVTLAGGADEESEDDLRSRVLFRIRNPPMGGDADDFVRWALEVPGVTRAWCSPLEMGVGTATLRFMMDDLRSTTDPMTSGFPTDSDITIVKAYIDAKRPVAVKDFFVAAPIPRPINITISNLSSDDASTRANIKDSISSMLHDRASPAFAVNGVGQPAQTIYAAWVSEAIMLAAGVEYFHLISSDEVMESPGHMAVLGTVFYG